MEGLILKGVGSFYTVLDAQGEEHVCRARGRFRKESVTPVPGDHVRFLHNPGEDGRIVEILPRRNILTRPAVANVDKLMIVMAASLPRPDLLLVDKLLFQCEQARITPVLVLNKCDERDEALYASILAQYEKTGYALHAVSAHSGAGLERLREELTGSVCCFDVFSEVDSVFFFHIRYYLFLLFIILLKYEFALLFVAVAIFANDGTE